MPTSFIHAPWLLPQAQQVALGCVIEKDYPAPLVNHDEAVVRARQRIAAFRLNPQLAGEIAAVFAKHGSRRRRTERTSKTIAAIQKLRLF